MATKTKKTAIDDAPQLVTHRDVAVKFGVTAKQVRVWVATRDFPAPHAAIGKTWFYKADVIAHKLRTGGWPSGVKFQGDPGT